MDHKGILYKVEPIDSVKNLFTEGNYELSNGVAPNCFGNILDWVRYFESEIQYLDDRVIHLLQIVFVLLIPVIVKEEAK